MEVKLDNCIVCVVKSNPKYWVICPKCNFSCCRTCTERYLLSLPVTEPSCMSCKTIWSSDFLAKHTHNDFHNNKYRHHVAKIIFEKEKSLLPATQPLVEAELKKKEIEKEVDEISFQITQVKDYLKELKIQKNNKLTLLNSDSHSIEIKNSRFYGFCSKTDCRGYLNDDYSCGLCKEKACKFCRSSKHEGECDKNIIETVKLLANDTKSCPSCHTPIFRISGCSIMFCTICKSSFCWNTGKIVRGNAHNPHRAEWLRNGGGNTRELGDIKCGGVDLYQLSKKTKDKSYDNWLYNAFRLSGHIRDMILPDFRIMPYSEQTYKIQRIKYLMGTLSIKDWVSDIKKTEKERDKKQVINFALEMFVDTIDDILRNIIAAKSENDIENHVIELSKLQEYIQYIFADISKRFENKMCRLETDWTLIWKLKRNYNFHPIK